MTIIQQHRARSSKKLTHLLKECRNEMVTYFPLELGLEPR